MDAEFVVNVVNVNPLETLSDAASSLDTSFQKSSGQFSAFVGDFTSSIADSASEILNKITNGTIQLSLNALLDTSVKVELSSSDGFDIEAKVNALQSSFFAIIQDDLSFNIVGDRFINIRPQVFLNLQAVNDAVPFDINTDIAANLANFTFTGDLEASVAIGVEDVPAELTLNATSDDLVSTI